MIFECSFSYIKGQDAKFNAKPQKGKFTSNYIYDSSNAEKSVATLKLYINVTPHETSVKD